MYRAVKCNTQQLNSKSSADGGNVAWVAKTRLYITIHINFKRKFGSGRFE